MKTIVLLTAMCSPFFSMAQSDVSISQGISDNGKSLTVKVNGVLNGKAIDYNNTFNISGLSKAGSEALAKKLLDSLGVGDFSMPATSGQTGTSHTMELKNEDAAPSVTSKNNYEQSFIVGGANPFIKEIKYNPKSGLLLMRYRFTKKGVENICEKRIDAKDKTADQRNELIKEYEREIGLP